MKNLIVICPQQSCSRSTPPNAAWADHPALAKSEIWLVNDGKMVFSGPSTPPVRVIQNPFRYGWGGVQKTALRYAAEHRFERVTMIGFYPDDVGSLVHALTRDLSSNEGFAVLKSNSLFSKFWRTVLRRVSGVSIPAWHGLCHVYTMSSMQKIAFELNTFNAHFDTEVLLQLADQKIPMRVVGAKISVPTPAIGLLRWINDLKSCLKFRLQKYGFLYDIRFHPELLETKRLPNKRENAYEPKFNAMSPHSIVLENDALVPPKSRVLDIGCSSGYVCEQLADRKKCEVVGIDMLSPDMVRKKGFKYMQLDLETGASAVGNLIEKGNFDVVLMLDVLEHLSNPEFFLLEIFKRKFSKPTKFVFSTGNVAFIGVRFMLLMGYFNYGERGILDITHKRLFSYKTFRNLMEQTGFYIRGQFFIPLPFQKMGVASPIARFFENVNRLMIMFFPRIFSYQVMFETELLTVSSPSKSE